MLSRVKTVCNKLQQDHSKIIALHGGTALKCINASIIKTKNNSILCQLTNFSEWPKQLKLLQGPLYLGEKHDGKVWGMSGNVIAATE